MHTQDVTAGAKSGKADRAQREPMLGVKDIARRLLVDVRTVHRMKDDGRLPQPIKLGRMVRWCADEFEAWIAAGCPRSRNASRKERE